MKKLLLLLTVFLMSANIASAANYTAIDPFNMSSGAVNTQGFQTKAFCQGATCTYTPLEPFSNTAPNRYGGWGAGTFSDYLNTVFKLLITLGSLFAIVMLVVAGIGYMVSEAAVDIEKAKQRARAALWGLLLLVGSWLILNTINPNLLKFNLNIPTTPGGTYSGGSTGAGGVDQPNNNSTACGSYTTGCSADYYCGNISGPLGNTGDNTCLPNTNRAAEQGCSTEGGVWTQGLSGAYCYLPKIKTKEECAEAGGTWGGFWSVYCSK